jgi:exodeoxyribonuclease V gamma subunit
VRARHLLSLWIRHLVLCWQRPAGSERASTIVGRAEKGADLGHYRLSEVENAAEHLADLLALYSLGQSEPLCLFPDSSLAYARALCDKPDRPDAAWAAARKVWPTELATEPHLVRTYGDGAALPGDPARADSHGDDAPEARTRFEELSLRVARPLLAHLSEVED